MNMPNTYEPTDEQSCLEAAMYAARMAFPIWKTQSVEQRLRNLTRLRQLLVRDMDEWIMLLSHEAHKTPMDTLMTELYVTLEAIAYYEKHAARMLRTRRKRTPIAFMGARSYVVHEPYGVLLVITPWNFPLQLALVPVISGLIAGNAVLLKPSEKLPNIAAKLSSTLIEAGFPVGLCQVIQGGREVVERLIEAKPDKIFFTGGEGAGRNILQRAAAHLIPCDMELSGKDPMIVCADANIERAAAAAVWGAFLNSGQACISVERVYVHRQLYQPFLEAVLRHTRSLQQDIGGRWADVGGMTTTEAWSKVQSQLQDAISGGAIVEIGGLTPDAEPPLFPPTVLTNVTNDMRVMREETFGPILPILAFDDESDAIRLANDSPYGLNASIFTRDVAQGRKIADQLETGNCVINDVVRNISNMHLPFGGVKQSGFGRIHGEEGLLSFCQSKSIMVKRGRQNREINWYPYKETAFTSMKKGIRFLFGGGPRL
ncbi:aldehyde dehydrogenase family protein [Paenibacillus alginolyticus]|uniref:Aldehyde dehydrogenase n=1 Tax=Paenibacillus alginolyticus TaxID=59839 RepID=A0ABT4GLI9_9BACL|nr:aldehyde dehydrogenase family protein [Paenibacillus alginolyticus]MCY9670205.1 aldehyde dehydrogenase family protein [Paenibacillus alginolyticus]MCY9697070.1 aldehyde dehydrogenase family protein [Paenibacillus alginolyticus]MEC0146439.1 aldehyde dehydrogenase family protein [Paenibacillus alginolyticus]